MKQSSLSFRAYMLAAIGPLSAILLASGCNNENIGTQALPLEAACIDSSEAPPADGWVCGADLQVECDSHAGAHVDYIYTKLPSEQLCADATLTINHPETFFGPGSYDVVVEVSLNGEPAGPLCSSTLTVVDTQTPEVTTHEVELWPPNHKYHHITPADVVTVIDACDADVKVWFTSVSSDEPVDDIGDGHTDPDIRNFGCDCVDLRAERQGPSDGRVYTLGWHAEDHYGNAIEGTARVVVPHDQSGRPAVDSGENHRVDLESDDCRANHLPTEQTVP
jgi:hypothetical protein